MLRNWKKILKEVVLVIVDAVSQLLPGGIEKNNQTSLDRMASL
jgi:hypothetical protein